MNVGGFTPFTLSDFPGKAAAIVFTRGCNFRCPFCHNGQLLPQAPPVKYDIPENEVFELLDRRRRQLDGVVVTGGEPTLQKDLEKFLLRIKKLGFEVKLDTNGSRPEIVQNLIEKNLVDYMAMDVKAPLPAYARLAGVDVDITNIKKSIALIAQSGLEHEFRTTVVESLLSPADIEIIKNLVPHGSAHRLQRFIPDYALDHSLREESRTTDHQAA